VCNGLHGFLRGCQISICIFQTGACFAGYRRSRAWRKTSPSSTTSLSLMLGFCASHLGDSFLSSIVAVLSTALIVAVFC
jgi:hypothetical protein